MLKNTLQLKGTRIVSCEKYVYLPKWRRMKSLMAICVGDILVSGE